MLTELTSGSQTQHRLPKRPARILIADTQPDAADSLKSLLKGYREYELLLAASEDEILAYLREGYRHPQRQIDLLVMASQVAGKDSLDLCRQLSRSDFSTTPVVLITDGQGWWDGHTAQQAYSAGAIDILFRPLRVADVIPRINLALSYRQERQRRLENEERLETELSEQRIQDTRHNFLLNHDELTGLANRRKLESELGLNINRCRQLGRQGALLYIDINEFGIINDVLGHECGDKLLKRVADLLRTRVPQKSLIARLGSDEFGVLLENADPQQSVQVAGNILQAVADITCKGEDAAPLDIQANIGVVMIEPSGELKDANQTLNCANQACHIARKRDDNQPYLFQLDDPEVLALQAARKAVATVRRALSVGGFELYLQPIIRLADGRLSHYEALLRLRDAQGKQYAPACFMPSAERTGLVKRIDYWVVENAIELAQHLPIDQGLLNISINLSGCGLADPQLIELIRNKLEATELRPSRLTFEITETAAIADLSKTREIVARLRAMGCHFAIDDFGSGFSSFNYIRSFPVEYLKLDGMFVRNVARDAQDQILVRSMIEIAHSLGRQVIAECVEDADSLAMLQQLGADYVQGYHLGRPVPASEIILPI